MISPCSPPPPPRNTQDPICSAQFADADASWKGLLRSAGQISRVEDVTTSYEGEHRSSSTKLLSDASSFLRDEFPQSIGKGCIYGRCNRCVELPKSKDSKDGFASLVCFGCRPCLASGFQQNNGCKISPRNCGACFLPNDKSTTAKATWF